MPLSMASTRPKSLFMKINSFIQYAQFAAPLKAAAVVPAQSKVAVSKWCAIKLAYVQAPELKRPARRPREAAP